MTNEYICTKSGRKITHPQDTILVGTESPEKISWTQFQHYISAKLTSVQHLQASSTSPFVKGKGPCMYVLVVHWEWIPDPLKGVVAIDPAGY